jgi:hypothetical protein
MFLALVFTITVAVLCGTATAEQPSVTIVSRCEFRGARAQGRWSALYHGTKPTRVS